MTLDRSDKFRIHHRNLLGMTHTGEMSTLPSLMAIINIGIVILMGLLILSVSSGLLKPEPIAPRALILSAWNYLKSGPVSLAFAILIFAVEAAVVATGTKEQLRSEFGLPNDNAWAYFVYAFLHDDITHLLENAGALLICGGIVEGRMKSRWLLVLAALFIPLGGYLATLTAPVFIDSPWTGDLPSVGFSIVDYAVLALCSFFVIDFVLKERFFRLASERRKRLLGTAIVTLYLLCSFISGVSDGPGESILGHSIGIALGAVAGGTWWVVHRPRPPSASGMSVLLVACPQIHHLTVERASATLVVGLGILG